MKKIVSLFKRDYEGTHQVYNEIVEGAEWVVAGEGIATVKIDGTSCMVKDGVLYKRFDVRCKPRERFNQETMSKVAKFPKEPPAGFLPAQDPDPITGHWPGWLPVGDGPEDKWHREAFTGPWGDWTYELIGPKVQGNPYQLDYHYLARHGCSILYGAPRTFNEIKEYLSLNRMEGIVWWRDIDDEDCDKVKIKSRDFGLEWPIKEK